MFVAQACGLPVRYKFYDNKSQLKTSQFLSMNPKGSVPVLETERGLLFESDVIMRYFANLDDKNHLNGRTLIEKAKVECWADKMKKDLSNMASPKFMQQGLRAPNFIQMEDVLNEIPASLGQMEKNFAKNKYCLGDHMTTLDLTLLSNLYCNARGCFLPEIVMKKLPNLQKWMSNIMSQDWFSKLFGRSFSLKNNHSLVSQEAFKEFNSSLQPQVQKTEKKEKVNKKSKKEDKKAAKKVEKKVEEDDDFDPFATDNEDEDRKAIEAMKAKNLKEYQDKKALKPKVIAKSSVCFDVKGYEVDQDWEALGAKIKKEVNMDGLVWMDIVKVVPIAFGMKKLQLTMLIEDDKVQTDDVFELIEAWEDEVQSCDVFTFNKA